MHKLRSVEISGFRGAASPIRFRLADDANFLIGRNGTGKTTLIQIIYAALAVDVRALQASPFDTITLKFKKSGDRKVPTVIVKRDNDPQSPYIFSYGIQTDTKAQPEYFRLSPPRRRNQLSELGTRRLSTSNAELNSLKEYLSKLYRITWLSLHRTPAQVEVDELMFHATTVEELSDVDRRLKNAVTEVGKYFTRLDKIVTDKATSFQKDWFLSLTTRRNTPISLIRRLDFDAEKAALGSIFQRFGMKPEDYSQKIDHHFTTAQRAAAKMNGPNRDSVSFTEYMALFDTLRIHSLVEQWQILQESQKETYLPRNRFVDIIASMLYEKKAFVNRSNQTIVTSKFGTPIDLKELSSGEKQLIIFLSETLLQEQESCIFLADEPELSLHVEWQEALVPNILKVNSNAQILFATHSPDIVNSYQENIIEMEKLLN